MRIARGNTVDTMKQLQELYGLQPAKQFSESETAQTNKSDNITITRHAGLFHKLDRIKRDSPDKLKDILTSIISDALQDQDQKK